MSLTHHNGQRRFRCDCGRSIRLKPERVTMRSDLVCGGCGTHHPREDVEAQLDEDGLGA